MWGVQKRRRFKTVSMIFIVFTYSLSQLHYAYTACNNSCKISNTPFKLQIPILNHSPIHIHIPYSFFSPNQSNSQIYVYNIFFPKPQQLLYSKISKCSEWEFIATNRLYNIHKSIIDREPYSMKKTKVWMVHIWLR